MNKARISHRFRAATFLTFSLTSHFSNISAFTIYTSAHKYFARSVSGLAVSSLVHNTHLNLQQGTQTRSLSFSCISNRFIYSMKKKADLPATGLRRSDRIRERTESAFSSTTTIFENLGNEDPTTPIPPARKTRNSTRTKTSSPPTIKSNKRSKSTKTTKRKKQDSQSCLPRTRELELLQNYSETDLLHIMGIDEAGRGPLAGPVVAAAVLSMEDIPGITDSKKITKETDREALFQLILKSPKMYWAAVIVDAQRIDEINILQATLEAMSYAAKGVMGLYGSHKMEKEDLPCTPFSLKNGVQLQDGCYILTSPNVPKSNSSKQNFHALIDGNKIPKTMPCPSESIVKGDSKEYSIGAASIIAKVIRDQLMHLYHDEYPEYNLQQHKGYPTAAHMQAVRKFGASPIHRRTFAPLKHLDLDEDGKIID